MRISVFILSIFLFLSCTPTQKDSLINESIVYLKSADGNFDIYQSDVLGQWESRLTTNEGWDWKPQWNDHLQKVIHYSNDTAGNFNIKAIGLNGDLEILPYGELVNYQLSQNGQYIFYEIADGDNRSIWRCRFDGSEHKELTQGGFYNGRFSLSKDGNKMAFISNRTGGNELYWMDLSTQETFRLTNNELVEKYITWSPMGDQIAFTMAEPSDDPIWDIFIIDLETLAVSQLTKTPYSEQEISWSPSGKKIAFHGTTDNDGDQIYTIDIADRKFTKITSGDHYHGEPSWIPQK